MKLNLLHSDRDLREVAYEQYAMENPRDRNTHIGEWMQKQNVYYRQMVFHATYIRSLLKLQETMNQRAHDEYMAELEGKGDE